MLQKLSAAFFLSFIFLLAGCQAELFSQVSENEANEMVSILLKHGIDAEKVVGKKGMVAVWVDKGEMAQSIQLLKNEGYPKEKFSNLGDVFTKEGLISSPLEERARYIYAVSQELSETFSNIDGVLAARVHVVLPEEDKTGVSKNPSSASVFIKYRPGANLQAYIPQIKLLVNNSIEGLDYEKISVVLFPAQRNDQLERENQRILAQSSQPAWLMLAGVVVLAVLVVGGVIFLVVRKK